MISLIVLPLCPTTSPIFSGSIWIDTILGAYLDTSLRGSAIALLMHSSMMKSLASRHCAIAVSTIGFVRPWILISIWIAVIPSFVPVTLKSMSPKKSSRPWISVRTTKSSSVSPVTRPQEIPATIFLIGTPAAISDMHDAQVEAIDVDPFDSNVSDTARIAYGNSSTLGRTGRSALSARAPCPISLRPGPLETFVSPTE